MNTILELANKLSLKTILPGDQQLCHWNFFVWKLHHWTHTCTLKMKKVDVGWLVDYFTRVFRPWCAIPCSYLMNFELASIKFQVLLPESSWLKRLFKGNDNVVYILTDFIQYDRLWQDHRNMMTWYFKCLISSSLKPLKRIYYNMIPVLNDSCDSNDLK